MSQDIQKLLAAAGLDSTVFEPSSRYYSKPLTISVTPEGDTVVHTTRRFVPDSGNFELLQYHFVEEGDRLDNVAHVHLGDAQQFWRLCDANRVDRPDELTEEIGSAIRITLPDGVPGGGNA